MNKETETVKVTVTLELPKNVHKLLKNFATFAGVTLEEMLKDQLEPDIEGFYQNDMFREWVKYAIDNAGCADFFQTK